MTRAFRYDLVGTVVPPAVVEDCGFCGADVNLKGECSASCEASRRARAKKDEDTSRLRVRHG